MTNKCEYHRSSCGTPDTHLASQDRSAPRAGDTEILVSDKRPRPDEDSIALMPKYREMRPRMTLRRTARVKRARCLAKERLVVDRSHEEEVLVTTSSTTYNDPHFSRMSSSLLCILKLAEISRGQQHRVPHPRAMSMVRMSRTAPNWPLSPNNERSRRLLIVCGDDLPTREPCGLPSAVNLVSRTYRLAKCS